MGADADEANALRENDDCQIDCAEVTMPQSSQQSVDAEADKWGNEWQVGADLPPLQWPEDQQDRAEMSQLTVEFVAQPARTFPEGSGLGWDKAHRRPCCDARQECGKPW